MDKKNGTNIVEKTKTNAVKNLKPIMSKFFMIGTETSDTEANIAGRAVVVA